MFRKNFIFMCSGVFFFSACFRHWIRLYWRNSATRGICRVSYQIYPSHVRLNVFIKNQVCRLVYVARFRFKNCCITVLKFSRLVLTITKSQNCVGSLSVVCYFSLDTSTDTTRLCAFVYSEQRRQNKTKEAKNVIETLFLMVCCVQILNCMQFDSHTWFHFMSRDDIFQLLWRCFIKMYLIFFFYGTYERKRGI